MSRQGPSGSRARPCAGRPFPGQVPNRSHIEARVSVLWQTKGGKRTFTTRDRRPSTVDRLGVSCLWIDCAESLSITLLAPGTLSAFHPGRVARLGSGQPRRRSLLSPPRRVAPLWTPPGSLTSSVEPYTKLACPVKDRAGSRTAPRQRSKSVSPRPANLLSLACPEKSPADPLARGTTDHGRATLARSRRLSGARAAETETARRGL